MKGITPFVWIVPGAMLLVALAPLPYGYYTALRIVVCGAAGFLAYKQYEKDQGVSGWMVALVGIAILFNPLIPVQLGRETWAFIDPATAAVFGAHCLASRQAKVRE